MRTSRSTRVPHQAVPGVPPALVQRWPRWGFRAEQLADPHRDQDQAGRWHTGSGDTAANLIVALEAAGEQTRAVVAEAELASLSTPEGVTMT